MIFEKIASLRKNFMNRGATYYALGKDVYEYGRDLIKERMSQKNSAESSSAQNQDGADYLKDIKRKNLERNFSMPDPNDPSELAKQKSYKQSQGVSDHSGSSYNGPGKPGENVNSNMAHRNFDNHQGN